METLHGPGLVSDFALELMIPLSDEDSTRFLSMLMGDQMESVMICQFPLSFPFPSHFPCPEHDVKLYQLCFMLHDYDRYMEQSFSQDTLV